MNKKLNKFLCIYFSDEDNKKVTLRTLLIHIILYLIILSLLSMILYSVYSASTEVYDCIRGVSCFDETSINNRLIFEVFGIIIIICIISIFGFNIILFVIKLIFSIIYFILEFIYHKFFKKLLDLEITKCEKKE